jgi:hypothetical protein
LAREDQARSIGAITRLLLFISRPYHLSDQEADRWMRSQAAGLEKGEQVTRVEVSRLLSPAARPGAEWDWLIELHCDGVEGAGRAAREAALRDLVADLRMLGMRPRLVLAEGTRPLSG